MSNDRSFVFLLDVDNTLLDNDRFAADLDAELVAQVGEVERKRYWSIYETLRNEVGYADYLGALQRFRGERDDRPELYRLSSWMLDYPFEQRLYPEVFLTLAAVREHSRLVILSDGDIVFQPRKIERAGLRVAVDDHIMIFVHKERALDLVQQRYPASHYVMVDDKPNLLAAIKTVLGDRVSTVFVQQGHYAAQADMTTIHPAPDHTIARIADLPSCAAQLMRG